MKDNDKLAFYAVAFLLKNTFSKPKIDFNKDVVMSVKNADDVFLAIKKAYLDAQPRTNKKTGKEQSKDEWKNGKLQLFKELAKKITVIFENYDKSKMTNELFDKIHTELCTFYLKEYNRISKDYGGYRDSCYGKAQKVINMTFKYVFCFDDAQGYVDIFNCCHMALDSYILRWYYDVVAKKCKESEVVKDINEVTLRKKRYAWSNLKNDEEYKKIQDQIKEYLEKDNDRSDLKKLPFFAEFEIWENQKNA